MPRCPHSAAVPPCPPRRLPTTRDFDVATSTIAPAYGQAWLAMDLIADDEGDDALVRFYRAVAGIPADASVNVSDDWPQPADPVTVFTALDTTEKAFTQQWRTALDAL